MLQFIMVLRVLVAVITVPTGTINLEQIDMTDGEWVAPGYEVVTKLDFDPLEYVDNVQAAQAFFMDTEEGEKLRIILVGDNRVLVFDEPWDNPMEYSVESPWEVYLVTMSRNGKYIALCVVKDSLVVPTIGFGPEITERIWWGHRLEITDEGIKSEPFNPRPGNLNYMRYMSDDGRIAASNSRGVISLYPREDTEEFLSRPACNDMWRRRACSYDSSIITLGNLPNDNGQRVIECYDWSGNFLWETPIGDRNLTSLRISPSGEYVLAPARNGGVVCYSGQDGSELWSTCEGLMCDFPQISPDGMFWVMSPDAFGHCYFYNGTLDDTDNSGLISVSEIISNSAGNPVCLSVNNSGYTLLWIQDKDNSHRVTLVYIDPNNDIVWKYNPINTGSSNQEFCFPAHMFNTTPYFGQTIAAISQDGSWICYTDYHSIKVLLFRDVD